MRYLLLTFLLLSVSKSYSQLDTIQCSSQFPSYVNDAKYLALREIISINDPYRDSAIIPASHYIPILRDLYAISQYGNLRINSLYPYSNIIDSIFGLLSIHARADADASMVTVTVTGSTGWVQNIFNDSIYSGNDTLDNLFNQYGLYYASPYHLSNLYIFNVLASYPVNMTPIMNTISTMAQTSASFGQLIGDASNIYMVDSGYVRHYTFRYGGGDCPAGCTINYYWKFSVYPNCIVQFDTSYGFNNWYYGIEDMNEGKLNVYPNPASGRVTIQFSDNEYKGDLKLSSMNGSVVQQITVSGPKAELDISGLSPGIYDLVYTRQDRVTHRKLTVY